MTREKFFRYVLGNIVIGLSVVAVMLVAFLPEKSVQPMDAENEPIYSGESDTRVALMVNVYWGTEFIQPMLDIFKRYNVKSTFFIGGVWAASNSEVLKTIYQAGHEIGNHGYNHRDHDKISAKANYDEINSTHQLVKQILSINMTLFAPPSGAFNDNTLNQASLLGYKSILWTRDTVDWRDHDSALIKKRALNNMKGGDLILMHPTKCTVEALEEIIQGIYTLGLKPSTVSQTLQGSVIT